MHTILFMALFFRFLGFYIVLLITQIHLSIAQANTSFKHHNTCMFMYATPTIITKVHHLVTQV